jgi:4-hydroxymandelate oxidase
MPTRPLNVAEYETAARDRMDAGAFAYYAGGAGDEWTLIENERAFERHRLLPRVLVDVSHPDTTTTVLGTRVSMPVLVAPTALHRLAHPEGEAATARAAAAAGTVMVMSTIASMPMEDVAAVAPGAPRWYQLYVHRDRAITEDLVRRAEANGFGALVLTVDTPTLGRRERDLRLGFDLPAGVTLANLAVSERSLAAAAVSAAPAPTLHPEGFARHAHDHLDPSITWDGLAWLASLSRLPIVLKGVLHPEDGRLAVEYGAAAVIVSNHGGRQLDGVPGSADALPGVVEAVSGRIPVLMDGGVRRGTDVIKALALGADAVLVGRPVLWGLAAEGEEGVRRVLQLLRDEIEMALVLSGRPTVASVDRTLLVPGR